MNNLNLHAFTEIIQIQTQVSSIFECNNRKLLSIQHVDNTLLFALFTIIFCVQYRILSIKYFKKFPLLIS